LLLRHFVLLLLHVHESISELFLHVAVLVLLILSVSLRLKLSSLLLLNLLQSFQKELLNIRSLVQDHLCQSFQVDALFHLESAGLSQRLQLLILLFNDLLVLKLYQLSFFFEVLHYLRKRGLKQINLGLEHLDLFVLLILLNSNLLVTLLLLGQLSIKLLVLV
jgi:hypothetical protein